MTTRRTTAPNDKALGSFLAAKRQIDHMLARIQTLSDDHFDTDPGLLREIADMQADDGDVILGADENGHNDLMSRIAAFLAAHDR